MRDMTHSSSVCVCVRHDSVRFVPSRVALLYTAANAMTPNFLSAYIQRHLPKHPTPTPTHPPTQQHRATFRARSADGRGGGIEGVSRDGGIAEEMRKDSRDSTTCKPSSNEPVIPGITSLYKRDSERGRGRELERPAWGDWGPAAARTHLMPGVTPTHTHAHTHWARSSPD